jgi:outer membrane immunogenic protein
VEWHFSSRIACTSKLFNIGGNVMSVVKFVRAGAALLSAILLPLSTQAADLYGGYKEPPAYGPLPLWQGFYLGANIGAGWSSIDPASNVVLLGGGGSIPIGSLSSSGLLGGMQFGYNVQAGNFVYGIEFDLGGFDTGEKGSFADPATPARVLNVKSSGGFFGDITGRAGFSVGAALIYAKGGFAFFTGDVRVVDGFDNIRQDSGTFTGWTVGGGMEYFIAPNWTAKAEYMYYNFDNNNFSCCTGAATNRIENSLTASTVKIGFNYLLHSLRGPLY